MAKSNEDWSVQLDAVSYSHLVELSQNLSKAEGLVKKLVQNHKPWGTDNEFGNNSRNFSSADNGSENGWPNSSKTENEETNQWPASNDWDSTNNGEASNVKNNNSENTWNVSGWDDNWGNEPDWSKITSPNEITLDWDPPKVSEWDNGWEKSDSKESKQEKIDWEPFEKSGW